MSILLLVLKIIFYIILAVLGLIVLVLCLPVSAEAGFIGKKLTYKVRYWFINVYDSEGKGVAAWVMKRKKKTKPRKTPEKPADTFQEPEIPAPPEEPEAPVELPEPETVQAADEPEIQPEIQPEPEITEDCAGYESPEPETSAPDEPDPFDDDTADEDSEDKPKSGKSKKDLIFGILQAADRPLLKIFKGIKLSEVYIDFIIANEDAYKCALNYGRISGAVYNLLGWLGALCDIKYKTVDINPGFAQKNSRWDISLRIGFRPITLVIAGIMLLITYIFKVSFPKSWNLEN